MNTRTVKSIIQSILRRVQRALRPNPDRFLKVCRSVIHVGANDGGERDTYARYKQKVLWIEASPNMFQTLTQNLKGYPEQKAANALVTDKEGELYKFNISSNSEASSSIYDLREHKQLWPEVVFTNTVHLKSTTLPTVVRDAGMSGVAFDALILDVQGAELLVVKGAGQVLDSIRFIKAEAADFESYRGGCTAATLSKALEERGFRIHMKERFASKEGVGSYYNIIYCRNV